MEIIYDLDKLRKPAKPLEFLTSNGPDTEEGQKIVDTLKRFLDENKDVVAIAAPQLDIDSRIFCIRFNDVIKTFINPIITKKAGNSIGVETFVSMPGKEILIQRPEEITVVYYTDEFKYEDNKLIGQAAKIFDQYAQLLDGVLPDDLGLVSDIEADGTIQDLTEEEFNEVKEYYLRYIEAKRQSLVDVVEADPELKKQYNSLRAAEEVINGRIKILEPEEEAKQRRALSKAGKASAILEQRQTKAAQTAERKAFLNRVSKRRGGKHGKGRVHS